MQNSYSLWFPQWTLYNTIYSMVDCTMSWVPVPHPGNVQLVWLKLIKVYYKFTILCTLQSIINIRYNVIYILWQKQLPFGNNWCYLNMSQIFASVSASADIYWLVFAYACIRIWIVFAYESASADMRIFTSDPSLVQMSDRYRVMVATTKAVHNLIAHNHS